MAGDWDDNAPDVAEDKIPDLPVFVDSLIEVTPESVFVGTWVNSPAGSGLIVYRDFAAAVWNTWAIELESYYQGDDAPKLMGEAAPPELRAGRRAFRALLNRYRAAGYRLELGDELSALCEQYCPDYGVDVGSVLPHDLQAVLDMAYPDEDDEDDEDDESRASAPPRNAFDLGNPEHLAWLQQALDYLQYL